MEYRNKTYSYKQKVTANGGYVNRAHVASFPPTPNTRFYGSNQKNARCLTALKEGLITDKQFAECYKAKTVRSHHEGCTPQRKPAHKVDDEDE